MKWLPDFLVRFSLVATCLFAAQTSRASCQLQIVSAGACLADGSAGNPSVGESYGLHVKFNVIGTPAKAFPVIWKIANFSYTNTASVGAGNGYTYHIVWPYPLDDEIPWSITFDPNGVSGNTDTTHNHASGTFTPTPPITPTDLYAPQVWMGTQSYVSVFANGNLSTFDALFGQPTTHGAQIALSDAGPAGANLIVTAPHSMPIYHYALANVPAGIFSNTNTFVIQASRTRVNPTLLRTNTWAGLAAMTSDWTQWLGPDARCQSTDPAIANFVQASLPADYLTSMTPYDTARTLHKAVMKALTYQEPPPAIDAVGVLTDHIGDCGGYAALLTASLRNVGIPARCISGFRTGDKIPHCRTEFHLPGTEWIVADATDGYDYDPTGTYAYCFGYTVDSDQFVAVDAGDAHDLLNQRLTFIQVPNVFATGTATSVSYTNSYELTPTPSVAVLASPSDAGTPSGEGAYSTGTHVQIGVTPKSGWAFVSWNDGNPANPRTVVISPSIKNYIANFSPSSGALVLSITNSGLGKVTPALSGETLKAGHQYTVTATPASGYLFAGWTGSVTNANPTLTFTMQAGFALQANFLANPFIGAKGPYNGLFSTTTGVTLPTAGMLKNLVIGQTGSYSASLLLNGTTYALLGKFGPASQTAVETVSRSTAAGGPITLTITLTNLNGPGFYLTGTVSNLNWLATLNAYVGTNDSPAGEYTLILPPDSNNPSPTASPGGYGYALITNNSTAKPSTSAATLFFTLPDGVAFSQTVPVAFGGQIPVYASLYANKGLLTGWISLNSATINVVGLTWIRPAIHGSFYPAGFTNVLTAAQLSISSWTNSAANFTNITNVAVGGTNIPVRVSSAGKITGPTVTGTITAKTGAWSVSIGSGSKKITAAGAIATSSGMGDGFFLTKSNSQAVVLEP